MEFSGTKKEETYNERGNSFFNIFYSFRDVVMMFWE